MASPANETTIQAVGRHLRNGYRILTERGPRSLFGAAMLEAAKIVDAPYGPFLAPRRILSHGPAFARAHGPRATLGALLRQLAAENDPPLDRRNPRLSAAARAAPIRYFHAHDLTERDGLVYARRLLDEFDFALETPFRHRDKPQSTAPVAAIVHAFYTDALEEILDRLGNVPVGVDLFLSTDTPAKRDEIAGLTRAWTKGSVEIRLAPNRGRDIAPKLLTFRDVYDRYDVFLHLHSKKSLHGGARLAGWRDYLLDTLIGDPDIAASNLSLFDDPRLGFVFPQHYFGIRGSLHWGYNYNLSRALMARMGVEIDRALALEFPSGSMFWGRSAALRPLLDLNFRIDDFPAESGQVDGTLAHAIERVLLMAGESRGYEWLKVVRRELYPFDRTILPVVAPDDVARHRLRVFQPCLVPIEDAVPLTPRSCVETRPVSVYPSHNGRPRLNLLIPALAPANGAQETERALRLFEEWADALGPEIDRRIVVTDAAIDRAQEARLARYARVAFTPGRDDASRGLVDASDRAAGRLDLRARDLFVATSWATADISRGIETHRARLHGGASPFVWLVQQDPPDGAVGSRDDALAAAALGRADHAIAVIAGEERYMRLAAAHAFQKTFHLPVKTSAHLAAPQAREPIILACARDGFELVREALTLWQQRDPVRASRWTIVFIGGPVDPGRIEPLQNARALETPDGPELSKLLGRALVGISIRLSADLDEPTFAMAQAGLDLVADTRADGDVLGRFAGLAAVQRLDPESLAGAIEAATSRMEPHVGSITAFRAPAPVAPPGPVADATAIRDVLRAAFAATGRTAGG